MSARAWATSAAMSGRWASWLMRSLPRMNLTSSLIGASLLAQPCIDHRLAAYCCACVEMSRIAFLSNPTIVPEPTVLLGRHTRVP
jgi:hypothetical protein